MPEGYALWTATSGAGDTIAAGLPNITGSLEGNYVGRNTPNIFSGALVAGSSSKKGSQGNDGTTGLKIDFNAHSSNEIYGSSTTVQPPAYKIYAWKRIS